MNFGYALDALRKGNRVSRSGWNGKGMWLSLVENYQIGHDPHITGLKLLPWIGMRTADGSFVPWLASQTDILSTDWEVLE